MHANTDSIAPTTLASIVIRNANLLISHSFAEDLNQNELTQTFEYHTLVSIPVNKKYAPQGAYFPFILYSPIKSFSRSCPGSSYFPRSLPVS